ncbi:MAG: hypothetical protein M3Y65_07600 [Pseudomonadota bacterium]|nr:hypothetical protein [Pseudomonadota bacterium]
MRPTDENQHGSTRPNLLSGARRRFSEDDNLLARLERDSARQVSGNRSRTAWYVTAAVLLLLLIVVSGYLAYQNTNTVQLVPVVRAPLGTDAGSAPTRDSPAAPHFPSSASPQTLPGTEASPIAHANSVALPPLVLLQPHEVSTNPSALLARHAGAPPPMPAVASRPSAIPSATPAPSMSMSATAPVQLAIRDVLPPATLVSHIAPRIAAPARTHKPAPATPVAEPAVDTDVVLLSAIILHASSHAEERAQLALAAACARAPEKRCAGSARARP